MAIDLQQCQENFRQRAATQQLRRLLIPASNPTDRWVCSSAKSLGSSNPRLTYHCPAKLNQMKLNQMKLNQMKLNQMKLSRTILFPLSLGWDNCPGWAGEILRI